MLKALIILTLVIGSLSLLLSLSRPRFTIPLSTSSPRAVLRPRKA